MPAKRKSKSQMIKIVPLPAFKAKMPIVQCFICDGTYPKQRLNQTKEIHARYVCDSCKKKYRGKVEFVNKSIDKAE